jgi:ketosteroid isomerase-like protein
MEPIRIEVVGDIAYQAGRCQMLVPVNMNRRREERGKYLIVLAKHEGDWKILSDCWSTDLSVGVVAEPAQPAATQAPGSPRKSA